ncbi:MAG: metallophosphoesterase family protein [Acidobacteriota bacterium]
MNEPRNPKEIRAAEDARASATSKMEAHRGMATWGERLVPIAEFRRAVATCGSDLGDKERQDVSRRFLERRPDTTAVEGPFERVIVFGGIYNNHLALEALLDEAVRRQVEAIYCLGDLGGFGPNPEKVRPLLEQGRVLSLQGNYEESLATGREDCNCGYTDPRDNHYADISYSYTANNCSHDFKRWMGTLPKRRRLRLGDRELLLVHGSPRRINEFLFASTSPAPFLEVLLDQEGCDGLLCTHTGLHWHRTLPSGRDVVNVGVIGRPANDGNPNVWFAFLEADGAGLDVSLLPLEYDHLGLAAEMRREDLPAAFIETIVTGWWTTCLEILPARERRDSKF